ncbi:MAG: archaeosortase/exosortase family protein [Candidatus Bathyarchaeota archaeon]|nr:archaeosortase/exosortase family protein [Candidatus Bathyarchaeota archaeon]
MRNVVRCIKKHSDTLVKLSPLLAFSAALLWLYGLDAASFELMWKGRTFQLFFIWLVGLELILNHEKLSLTKISKLTSARALSFFTALTSPTFYVAISFYGGLNTAITEWATKSRIPWASSVPLSAEYLVFTFLFCLMVYLSFGLKGLKFYLLPIFFLSLVGLLYMVDNVFPYGQFAPFQIVVPTTTALSAVILNLLGYPTTISYGQNNLGGNMPFLTAINPNITGAPSITFAIAWPCAGVESLLIFTVVSLLFLKRINLPKKVKIGFFVFGAAVTYLVNALRIVNIFLLGMTYGVNSLEVDVFHFYYGPLYAVTWIVSYPLIIILIQKYWSKRKRPKSHHATTTTLSV